MYVIQLLCWSYVSVKLDIFIKFSYLIYLLECCFNLLAAILSCEDQLIWYDLIFSLKLTQKRLSPVDMKLSLFEHHFEQV